MRHVRILVKNMQQGDVFVKHADERIVIVERPIRNMGKPAKQKRRKLYQPEPAAASVDHIMGQLALIGM